MPSKSKSKSKSKRSTVAVPDPIFEMCYERLKARINGDDFSSSDIIIFAVQGMQVVERYPQLTGPEKKQYVIRLAKRIVNDLAKIEEVDRAALLLAIDMLLPSMIDQVVAASRGQLDLNKIGKRCGSFWRGCCGKSDAQNAEGGAVSRGPDVQ